MKRVVDKPVQIGEKRHRYTFKIFDDPTEPGTPEYHRRRVDFLREFVDQPTLLQCGPAWATKMAIWHDGTRWTLSAEAEIDDV